MDRNKAKILFFSLLLPVLLLATGLLVAFAPALQGGASNFGGIHLNCTECSTATPVLLVNQPASTAAPMLAQFEVRQTPVAQLYGSNGGVRIYAPTAIATNVPALVIDTAGVGNALEIRRNGTPVAVYGNGGLQTNRSMFLRYQDVAAAPSIKAAATAVSATTTINTGILGIAVPRNVSITYETAVGTNATAGNITVTGVDARGSSTTELVAVSAVSGTQTLVGVVPWKSITSFTLPTRTEQITMTVAGGQLFGLPIIPKAASDVYHVVVNLTPQAAPTVSTVYGTFNPVSTPAANVDYDVWVKQ